MVNNCERGLILYREQSLAELDQGPKSKIQDVVRLNSEVYSHFKIGELLSVFNERLFGGKGEIEPLVHSYSVAPNVQENESSRFARLFSTTVRLNSVKSAARLRVKKDDLRKDKEKTIPFDELVIGISQSMGMRREVYTFTTNASLIWKSSKRDSDGNWDSKPFRLVSVSEGRLLSFYLHSIPPTEKISEVLLEQVVELLRELSVQDLIPEIPN